LAKFNTIEEVIDDSEAIDLQLGQGVYRDDPRFMRVRHSSLLHPSLVLVVLAVRASEPPVALASGLLRDRASVRQWVYKVGLRAARSAGAHGREAGRVKMRLTVEWVMFLRRCASTRTW
jgi:hypothetical protein